MFVAELEILAKTRAPLPDTFHGLTDVEARYRRRYLDLLMNEQTRADFLLRTRIVTAVRRRLDDDGFVEVETPVLQPRFGGAFARPFVTHHNELEADFYLRVATELYLKRLIVGGLERVYEIGKDFRNEGVSYKHQPEFTMLEWYEAYADYRDTMARIERLIEGVATDVNGGTTVVFRGHEIDLKAPWERLGFVESLERHELWTRDEAELRSWLTERGVDTSSDREWAQLVDHAFSHFVEPTLIQPTIVHDYPLELSPFARATDGDPTLTERFEYFAGGMELGNAFSEINDAQEQAERFALQAGQAEGEAGRSGLRRGALLRNAADRRSRARHRPAGNAPLGAGDDPRRDPLPGAQGALLAARMRSRRFVLLGAAVLGIAVALLVGVLQAERYSSAALVVIGAPGSLPEPDPDFAPYVGAALELLRTEAVARRTIDDLRLDETPKHLLGRVSVSAGKESPVLRVAVEDGSPEQARRVAQDFAESFTILFTDRFGAGARPLQATIWEQPQDAEQVAPRPLRNALLGALGGLLAGVLALRVPAAAAGGFRRAAAACARRSPTGRARARARGGARARRPAPRRGRRRLEPPRARGARHRAWRGVSGPRRGLELLSRVAPRLRGAGRRPAAVVRCARGRGLRRPARPPASRARKLGRGRSRRRARVRDDVGEDLREVALGCQPIAASIFSIDGMRWSMSSIPSP